MRAKVEFYEDESGEHRWRVRAANGETIATGEAHTRERDAVRAFLRAVRIMSEAEYNYTAISSGD